MKILAFTTDLIPLAGLPTSGTALRTLGLIQGLRAHGHQVVVSVPKTALSGLSTSLDLGALDQSVKDQLELLKSFAFDGANQSSILNEVNPDAVICGHWPAMTLRTKPSQTLIIDLAGPHLLERYYQNAPNQIGATLAKLAVLNKADYFIVSGPTQRLYFLSFLLRAEVENPEERIIQITMPLNPKQPALRKQPTEHFPHFIFGGVFLPWQDPSQSLTEITEELSARGQGHLTLIGGKHPNYPINEGVYAKLFAELSKNPRVVSKPMLPYGEFLNELGQVDVAIDLMKWNLERELAVTIRTTSYLWAGVPVIYNNYADLGRLIESYDAGWSISPDRPEEFHRVCNEIFESSELVQKKSQNASRLAKDVFSWDRAVEPLLSVLAAGTSERLRETDIILDFPDNADLPVYRGQSVEQHFLCRINGLTKIECRLATHNRRLEKPVIMALYEIEERLDSKAPAVPPKARRLVARREYLAQSLQNNEWCALEVEPLAHSAGKTYVLAMETEEKDLETSISPWAVRGSPYPMLGLYHGSRKLDHASLCFRTTCTRTQ